MRIPLIQQYEGVLLTGERKSHNGKIKWNQNEPILNMYNKIFDYFNINNYLPFFAKSYKLSIITWNKSSVLISISS